MSTYSSTDHRAAVVLEQLKEAHEDILPEHVFNNKYLFWTIFYSAFKYSIYLAI